MAMHDRQAGRLMTAGKWLQSGGDIEKLTSEVAMAAGCSCTFPVGSLCCYTTGQIPILQELCYTIFTSQCYSQSRETIRASINCASKQASSW